LAKLYPSRAPRSDFINPAARNGITIKLKYFSDISSLAAISFNKTGLTPLPQANVVISRVPYLDLVESFIKIT
jgi:hypothetical protein